MKAPEAEKKARHGRPIKECGTGNNEKEETDSLDHRGSPFAETPESVRATPTSSPLRFYARLRHELEIRGVDLDRLPRLTPENESPPCFRHSDVSFDDWLASASLLGATVPYRYDMPAEPNYCWDCGPEHKRKAIAAGVCLFPGTRFEKNRTVVRDDQGKTIETETVGISRSETVVLDLKAEYDPEL